MIARSLEMLTETEFVSKKKPPREYVIVAMPGDGIGPEQFKATKLVIDRVVSVLKIPIRIRIVEAGDSAYYKYGKALPDDTLKAVYSSHACLKGPMGERAADVIVRLRQDLDLFVNLRPAKTYPNIKTPIKKKLDLVIVRENTEGLYKGFEWMLTNEVAAALRVISYSASIRIAKFAFNLARIRRKKVTIVHKANVLRKTCGLFVRASKEVAKSFPDVRVEEQYIDACAANLIRKPESFDVILTTNLFGDILSDEAAQLAGSLGLGPCGNIGFDYAIFEPVHGAAFDIAGKGIANPISMILSACMMFEWLGMRYSDERCMMAGRLIEEATESVLSEGKKLTPDLGGSCTTLEVAEEIAGRIG